MKYDYVKVDPKVIQMLGGEDGVDETSAELSGDLPGGSFDKIPKSNSGIGLLETFGNSFSNFQQSEPAQEEGDLLQQVLKGNSDLLLQILQELRNIKSILLNR